MASPKIYISYRRQDSAADAARLYDRLGHSFGPRNIFLDVEGILPGVDFAEFISTKVREAGVVLVLIGPRWLEARSESGERRIDDPTDLIRLEIATALAQGTRVIPIVVDHAVMPRREDLPPDIRDLVLRHALVLRHEAFGLDTARIVETIKRATKEASSISDSRRKSLRAGPFLVALVFGGLALTSAYILLKHPISLPENYQIPFEKLTAYKNAITQFISDAFHKLSDGFSWAAPFLLITGAFIFLITIIITKRFLLRSLFLRMRLIIPKGVTSTKSPSEPLHSLPTVGLVFRDFSSGPEMVVVPSGRFLMGADPSLPKYTDDLPLREIEIASAFAVSKYPILFDEWDAFLNDQACHRPDDCGWGRGKHPVVNVSWDDAQTYVAWLQRVTFKHYRLLSEEEWEYCCRAGTTTPYNTGLTIRTRQAHFSEREFGEALSTQECGTFAPNSFALCEMHGNVWEWTANDWRTQRSLASNKNGEPNPSSARKVVRGGGWSYNKDTLLSSRRRWNTVTYRSDCIGFRVARSL